MDNQFKKIIGYDYKLINIDDKDNIATYIKDFIDVNDFITTLNLKYILRDEGYFVTQEMISKFLQLNYKDYNLNFCENNGYREYFYDNQNTKQNSNNIIKTTKTNNITETYICKFYNNEVDINYYFVCEELSYGKAKYNFLKEYNKLAISKSSVSKIDYITILCKKIKFNVDELNKNKILACYFDFEPRLVNWN